MSTEQAGSAEDSESIGPMPIEETGESIELDRFLKLAQIVSSGGEAKQLIRSGTVLVNGSVETRRGRKLRHGDRVEANGEEFVIETD
ncbi:MAG: RNA-binding S4 domain-containing protein [Planctomycetota bacterium]